MNGDMFLFDEFQSNRPRGSRRPVVDLQRAGHVGLRDACATWLGRRLDKSEQCSDWDARPLTEAQVAYAALDAAVLFALHDAMCA